MTLGSFFGFQKLPLLFWPDALVVDKIFLRAQLRYRRHLFEQRNRVVEIQLRLPDERLQNPKAISFFELH
jgi:hypothetical protein